MRRPSNGLRSQGGARLEPRLAWGKPMLLDTSYTAAESPDEQLRLSKFRSALIDEYPQVGPIFA